LVVDGSSLEFLIEELISLGATDVAIPSESIAARFVDNVPKVLKKRIAVVDVKKVELERRAIFEPLAEEFDLKVDGVALTCHRTFEPKELHDALATVYFELETFLLGLEHELQINLDIDSLRKAVDVVRLSSRSATSRASLSVLAGVLASYESRGITSILVQSGASRHLAELFGELLEDETYKLMSRQAYCLGLPLRIQRTAKEFSRLARRLVTKPQFRYVLRLASRGMSLATQVPVPDVEALAPLIKKKYFPPAVSLKGIIPKARKAWEHTEPNFVPPPGERGFDVLKWSEEKTEKDGHVD